MNTWWTLRRHRRMIAWIALTALCIGYLPLAVTATFPYLWHGGNVETWAGHLLPPESTAARSIGEAIANRMGPYRASLVPIVVHTVLGGALMALGPVQFWTAARRHPWHRTIGRVYLGCVTVCMAAAAVYLIRTPWTEIFSGPVFAVGLWMFLIEVVLSTTLAVLAIRRREVDRHLRWMIFGYAFLLSAPILRVGWTVIMVVSPGVPLPTANLYSASMVFGVCTIGATVGVRLVDRRRTVPGMRDRWVSNRAFAACTVIGFAGFMLLGLVSLLWADQWTPLRLYFTGAYSVILELAFVMMVVHSEVTGNRLALQEWRVAFASQVLTPAAGLVAGALLHMATGLDWTRSVIAGIAIGWGACGFAAFLKVDHELRLAHRAAAGRPTNGTQIEDPAPIG